MKRFPVLSLCLVASGLAAASSLLCMAPIEAQTLNNAFGGLSESSNEPIDVKSDVMTVYTDDYVLFTGNVRAVQGTTTLRAKELKVHFRGNGSSNGNSDAAAESRAAPTSASSPEPATPKADEAAPASAPKPSAEAASEDKTQSSIEDPIDDAAAESRAAPTSASSPEPATPKADEAAPASAPKPSAEAASEDKTQSSIEDPIDIESDWLLVHDKEKYAHFKGNVRVVRGETKLRSEELKVDYAGGDNLAAATEANAGTPAQIKKIVARGSVHALLTQRGAKDTKMANRPGESAPGAATESAPGAATERAPGAATESAPGAATESAPGAASGKQSDEASTGTKVAGAGPQSETVPAPSAASKKREISRLEAKGDVVIVSEKDETSTSDWAIYNLPSQLVTIGGNVVLSQGQSVLKGDRLVIDLKTGESRFENTGTAASGGRRIRALFMPKDDAKPGAKPNTPVGGRGNGSAGDQRTPDEPVIDNGEPMPIVPEYR